MAPLDLELGGGGVIGAAGASTTDYKLTPTAYGPVAQYALQGDVSADFWPDRSGNARHLVSTINGPNLSPDGSSKKGIRSTRFVGAATAALQILGDLTCTCRAWAVLDTTPPGQMFFTQNDGNDISCPYFLGLDTAGKLITGIEKVGNVGVTYVSTLVPPFGRWCFFSVRRDVAAGTWTVGYNSTFETSAAMEVTSPLIGQPKLYVGGSDVTAVPWFWRGSVVDLSIWDTRLSDAQVIALGKATGVM